MTRIFKPMSVLLVLSIFLQSCTVYKRDPISLEQAAKTKKRVLMITADDKKIRLKRIEKVDTIYYGTVVGSRGDSIVLDQKNIKALRPLDQSKSTLGNFGFAALGALVITVFVLAATYDPM